MTREQFIELVLTHPDFEGGARLWNDPDGGPTRYGFSQRAHPRVDIPSVTLDWAKEQAFVEYWRPCHCDEMPAVIGFTVFDFAFNSGTDRAIRYLQNAAGVTVDGKIGPATLTAIAKTPASTAVDYLAARALFMSSLSNFKLNGKGWYRRLFMLSHVIHGGSV